MWAEAALVRIRAGGGRGQSADKEVEGDRLLGGAFGLP